MQPTIYTTPEHDLLRDQVARFLAREVEPHGQAWEDQGFVPRQRMLASEAKSAQAEMPVPVEPGKSTVTVTVSGSVQLR